eukprot:Nk52_evm1s1772 gene=Nk52_evmTU1s1772
MKHKDEKCTDVHHLTDEQEKKLLEVFRHFDKNETGDIEVLELRSVMSQFMGTTPTAHEIQEMIQSHNVDMNGKVTFKEFREILVDYMGETTKWGSKLHTKVEGYVGFDQVLNQFTKDIEKHGVEFNVMVVGETGLGKSTMINTLFMSKVSRDAKHAMKQGLAKQPTQKTVEIHSTMHVIEEKGLRLKLRVIDTPGFADKIDNRGCWQPIQKHIVHQMEKYFDEEQAIDRKRRIPDTRVHCCLYFLAPTGHSLKPLDVEFMKNLQHYVNIIPVIAKADTLTIAEREAFKQRIRDDLEYHKIHIFPHSADSDDELDVATANDIRSRLPFAVIGSDKEIMVNGQLVLGRKTKWGFVEVENDEHCEFLELRDLVIRTHLHDLLEVTRCIHYENYRKERLLKEIGVRKSEC